MVETVPVTPPTEIQKKRAAIYIRVSSKEQAEMYWEAVQRSQIDKFIDFRSREIELAWEDYIYIDSAVSWAEEISERKDLSRLFEDLEFASKRPFDTVIVYKIDRFARKLSILLEIVDKLDKHWVWFISTQELIDTESTFWKAMLQILWVFAELERETILERTSLGREQAKGAGTMMQDKYGYRRDSDKRPIIEKKESEVVKKIFGWYVDFGMSIPDIIRELEKYEIPIPAISMKNKKRVKKGNFYRWWDHTIRQILSDEIYIWKLYHDKTASVAEWKGKKKRKQIQLPKDKWKLSSHTHAPIIDPDTFEKAQKRLEKKWDYQNSNENYILSGLLKCDHCKKEDNTDMIHWKWTTTNWCKCYQCNGKNTKKFGPNVCETVPLPKHELEEFVVNNIKQLIQRPELIEKFIKNSNFDIIKQKRLEAQKEDLINKKEKLLGRKDNIEDMYANLDITQEKYNSYKLDLAKDLKVLPEIEAKITELTKAINKQVQADKYKKWFEILKELDKNMENIFKDEELTKKLLHYIIEEIIIYSRPRSANDHIPWPKKRKQYIPAHIEVVFKLPQEFFDEMHKQDLPDWSPEVDGMYPSGWTFYGPPHSGFEGIPIWDKDKKPPWKHRSELKESIDNPNTCNLLNLPIWTTKIGIALSDFFL